jgi:hypothetical protein
MRELGSSLRCISWSNLQAHLIQHYRRCSLWWRHTFRKNYAGIGYTYDAARDAFIPPKPYVSWVLNEDTCLWDSPTPYPTDGNRYLWNEESQSWNLITE